jgi:hypothetical protein
MVTEVQVDFWCDQNVSKACSELEVVDFLCDPAEECRWQRDLLAIADVKQQDDVWLQYAAGAPVVVPCCPQAVSDWRVGGCSG